MRNLLLAAILLSTCAFAQTTAPAPTAPAPASPPGAPYTGSGWERVHLVPIGTALHVKTMTRDKVDCVFISATEDFLNCGGITFQRANIQSIRIAHRVRSTLVGVAGGYGAALAVTAVAVSKGGNCGYFGCNNRCSSAGCVTAVAIVDLSLIVGTPIVAHITDFTAPTIYKAN